MPYTALGTPQTDWARHLDNIRRERKWSATALFEDCHAALGLGPKSLTSFKRVLVDKPMPADWAAALTKLYGQPPATAPAKEEPGPSADVTGLVMAMTSALLAQTQALTDLRADLVQVRDDAASERAAMTRMLARLEAQLAELLPRGDRAGAGAGPQSA